jgi:hypothetical protein
MANRITKQKWDEISGVDAPANGSPGWLLQKAADEVEDFEAAIVDLHKALGSDSAKLFFKDSDEAVQKAVTKLLKHLDENIEEVEDDEDEGDEPEEVKKEKRGIAKLAEILKVSVTKSEDGDEGDEPDENDEDEDTETSDADETDESADETDDEDETDENKDEDDEDEPVAKATALQKSDVDAIVSAFKEELDPIREAVGALADRTEGLEKHAAGRTSLLGQDGSEDEDDDGDENAVLHKAFTAAARGAGKIELN